MTPRARLVVVGDTLLDRDVDGTVDRVAPDAPVPVLTAAMSTTRPGGAGLAAVLAAADGRPVTLVTALADDRPGRQVARLLSEAGVQVVTLPLRGATPEKVRLRAGDRPLLRVDRGGRAGEVGDPSPAMQEAMEEAAAVLVSDYGRGVTAHPLVRAGVDRCRSSRPVVWDPHPRGATPLPGLRLVTPNAGEARRAATGPRGNGLAAVAARARELVRRWRAAAISVTLADRGALLVAADGSPMAVPVPPALRSVGTDPCGAGDRYAAAAAGALADGALVSEAVVDAVRAASAFIAAGGVAQVGDPAGVADGIRTWVRPPAAGSACGPQPAADAAEVIRQVRGRGGTVVATGGCFDLLHAGHVQMLQAARELGDCLVVCLNSDDSVRRLKGPGRPVVEETDRAAILLGLECVDAVALFDEDTPEAILDQLRPDLWAKGGDYAVGDLPEAQVMESWGGQALVLPYLAGRSTSQLIQGVHRHARQ